MTNFASTRQQYDWFSKEATTYFDSLTDKQLSERIDIVRQQITMAFNRRDGETLKSLQAQEDAIAAARVRKFPP